MYLDTDGWESRAFSFLFSFVMGGGGGVGEGFWGGGEAGKGGVQMVTHI